jgi:protein-S-isoprenylcysteine O-methyltransferase Ste14
MKTILPPTYLLASLVLAMTLWVFLPGPRVIDSPWNLTGIGLSLLGAGLNIVGDRQFQRAKTTMNPFGEAHVLVTAGVFRCSRHPMYLGLVLIVLGVATLLGYATPFVAPTLLWAVLHYRFIPHEERTMFERFGERYSRYVHKVRRRWV